MSYLDVVVLAVPEANVAAYQKMSKAMAKIWMKHGALQYIESIADDVPAGKVTDLYRAVKRKDGETLGFGVIVFRNRKHRDDVMKKVRSDPAVGAAMSSMPFDGSRMIFGGFKSFVELSAEG